MNSAASGSVYEDDNIDGSDGEGSENEADDNRKDDGEDEYDDDEEEYGKRRTRSNSAKKGKAKKPKVEVIYDDYEVPLAEAINREVVTQSGRRAQQKHSYIESSDNDDLKGTPPRSSRKPPRRHGANTTAILDSGDEEAGTGKRRLRKRPDRTASVSSHASHASKLEVQKNERAARLKKRHEEREAQDPDYNEAEDVDADGEANPEMELDDDAIEEPEPLSPVQHPRRVSNAAAKAYEDARGYKFRTRKNNVNYVIPPPLDHDDAYNRFLSKPKRPRPKNKIGWSLTGAELSRAMGLPLPGEDTVINRSYA